MRIPLTEPTSSKYLYINSDTNQMHLLVPFIAGEDISTDNTCKASLELRAFFAEGGAINELEFYKSALEFDMLLLGKGNPLYQAKEERLAQINKYLEAVKVMRGSYGNSVAHFLSKPSNLYSIQLRPRIQDPYSEVVNPVFNVNRRNDAAMEPLSPLYNSMQVIFRKTILKKLDPQTQLTDAVLRDLNDEEDDSFETIQRLLTKHCQRLFHQDIDFTKDQRAKFIDRAYINEQYKEPEDVKLTAEAYMVGLLNSCAPSLWTTIDAPVFYSVREANAEDKAERLSIMTQFYLGVMNVYCRAKGISNQNFGVILDSSPSLSQALVETVSEALSMGDDVENIICSFCNAYAAEFGLSRSLSEKDKDSIQQKFETTYRTVTATKENPYMDDFMILDTKATGRSAIFISLNGLICTDFANIVDPTAPHQTYFEEIRKTPRPEIKPRTQEPMATEVDIKPEALLDKLDDVPWERLPKQVKEACFALPAFQVRQFLHDVAKGKQEEAESVLNAPQNLQTLLRTAGKFTDYSERIFNCTAYEYAYWAKDTHMRRMLEHHMDEETKAHLLTRIDKIEEEGLTYFQHGKTIEHSKHFDLNPLIDALDTYVKGYDGWVKDENWHELEAAWMAVGKAQREVPAHVAQEYCRKDRSFDPTPSFKEETLPRTLAFYNHFKGREDSWFPLAGYSTSGLGFNFAFIRGELGRGGRGPWAVGARWAAAAMDEGDLPADLAAVSRLDEVRTIDLTLSREHLNPPASSLGLSM
ncbi:hypothetical protein [Legionella impletisoli]|uniref:SidC N-terminal domain-containing protein n=1 Tax=Legionella impletisoli TaxID=343510 RepID=A0A917JQ12_9GAMM|nr:hypothetical protein [Legionella impletisoli]GGI76933.1 hypothetical protein GCM10007966_02050 [Legionella impletisoli]